MANRDTINNFAKVGKPFIEALAYEYELGIEPWQRDLIHVPILFTERVFDQIRSSSKKKTTQDDTPFMDLAKIVNSAKVTATLDDQLASVGYQLMELYNGHTVYPHFHTNVLVEVNSEDNIFQQNPLQQYALLFFDFRARREVLFREDEMKKLHNAILAHITDPTLRAYVVERMMRNLNEPGLFLQAMNSVRHAEVDMNFFVKLALTVNNTSARSKVNTFMIKHRLCMADLVDPKEVSLTRAQIEKHVWDAVKHRSRYYPYDLVKWASLVGWDLLACDEFVKRWGVWATFMQFIERPDLVGGALEADWNPVSMTNVLHAKGTDRYCPCPQLKDLLSGSNLKYPLDVSALLLKVMKEDVDFFKRASDDNIMALVYDEPVEEIMYTVQQHYHKLLEIHSESISAEPNDAIHAA